MLVAFKLATPVVDVMAEAAVMGSQLVTPNRIKIPDFILVLVWIRAWIPARYRSPGESAPPGQKGPFLALTQ